ncbi:MAG: zinc ribbon domain-containing protein [Lachnospiraceae bacterium]|nr:zinc ribbon domain-containing protein [Lachnospiraceae bacterium]
MRLKDLAAKRYTDIFEAQTQSQVEIIREQTEAQKRIIESQSFAKKRELENYTYQEERGFDLAEKVAENESVSQFANMGVGLGLMAGVGGAMSGTMIGAMNSAMQAVQTPQPVVAQPFGVPVMGVTPVPVSPAVEAAVTAVPVQQDAPQSADTKVCQCGAVIGIKAKFCPECGAKQPKLCPGCGKVVSETAKFCDECGSKLG